MHVRMTTTEATEGTADVDAVVGHLRDHVHPEIRGQKGFRGITASADRAAGVISILTLWDSERDLEVSDALASDVRERAAKATGGHVVDVRVFEQLVWEIAENPPAPGCRLLVTPIKMDPTKIDDNLAFFRATVLPEMKATPGFRAVRNMIDRRTGEGMVGTVWSDEASLEGSLAQFAQRRARAEARGVTFGEPFRREVIFIGPA